MYIENELNAYFAKVTKYILTNLERLHFLKDAVKGDALDLICNIQLLDANFDVAWKLLCAQYENVPVLVNSHLNAIFNLTPIDRKSREGLTKLRMAVCNKFIGSKGRISGDLLTHIAIYRL